VHSEIPVRGASGFCLWCRENQRRFAAASDVAAVPADTPVAESVMLPARAAVVIASIPLVAAATSDVFSIGMVSIVLSDLPARISKYSIQLGLRAA